MANKAKANQTKLVPLKEQALTALRAALRDRESNTRPASIRRVLMGQRINQAWNLYYAGKYADAASAARQIRVDFMRCG